MSVVVDASVLVAALVDSGSHGEWAEAALVEHLLWAPHLLLAETYNVLRRLEAAHRIGNLEAAAAKRDAARLAVELVPFEPVAERVWELRANLTCYDAWYVAVAEALDAPLATLDSRIRNAPGPTCAFLFPD